MIRCNGRKVQIAHRNSEAAINALAVSKIACSHWHVSEPFDTIDARNRTDDFKLWEINAHIASKQA